MKSIKTVLLGIIVLVSCSSTQSIPTTTTTIKSELTTVAPIDYGNDCKRTSIDEVIRLGDARNIASDKWDEDQDKSHQIAQEAFFAHTSAWTALRSYVRTLDIPLVSAEQRNYVNAIQDYVAARNQYWESDREDLSVNDYLIPLSDAATDFLMALGDICNR